MCVCVFAVPYFLIASCTSEVCTNRNSTLIKFIHTHILNHLSQLSGHRQFTYSPWRTAGQKFNSCQLLLQFIDHVTLSWKHTYNFSGNDVCLSGLGTYRMPFIYCAYVCRHLFMAVSLSIATFSETTIVCTLCVCVPNRLYDHHSLANRRVDWVGDECTHLHHFQPVWCVYMSSVLFNEVNR